MKLNIRANPWKGDTCPENILVIRYQALGDTVITLPYLQHLKRQYPIVNLHLLTRKEVGQIPGSLKIFSRIIEVGGGRKAKLIFFLSLLKLPQLWFSRYDLVLDLQNNKISRIIRKLLFVKAWAEFDGTSPVSAEERIRRTIEAAWTWNIAADTHFISHDSDKTLELLAQNGYKPDHDLIVLNPAGHCSAKNWPLEYYAEFAFCWKERIRRETQFVLLLLPALRQKADYLSEMLGDNCIDLTGKADQFTAFSIIRKCSLVLSEDSGLMHMAWVQDVPTVALFSSSRKDWSAPAGKKSICLDSSDLECGPCGLEVCKFGDNRCLTRYSPGYVVEKALKVWRTT
jgi:heptosyltransferase II